MEIYEKRLLNITIPTGEILNRYQSSSLPVTGTLRCLMYLFRLSRTVKSSDGVDLQYGAHVHVFGLLFTHWENTALFYHSFQLIFDSDSIHITLAVKGKHRVINIQVVCDLLSLCVSAPLSFSRQIHIKPRTSVVYSFEIINSKTASLKGIIT